jgi:hypothetical protein
LRRILGTPTEYARTIAAGLTLYAEVVGPILAGIRPFLGLAMAYLPERLAGHPSYAYGTLRAADG